jgi:hypothetical protein
MSRSPMPQRDLPAAVRHQILVDPTGRRRHRLAIAGRLATAVLGLWLLVLILGGLGLQPLAGLPIVGDLGAGGTAPPALPERLQAAAAKRTTVAPATEAPRAPVTIVHVPSHNPAVTAPSRARTRPPVSTTTPGRAKTTPTVAPTSPTPAPSRPERGPPTTTPGQTRNPPGQTRNPPGQTSNPPGQTKTGPGPPTSTPGGNGVGNARGAKGTVTTP